MEVAFYDGYQFLKGLRLRCPDHVGWREKMIPDVSFNQPCHEAVQGTAAGCYQLKNIFAAAAALDYPFDRLDLPLDTADSPELSLQIFCCVRQRLSSPKILFISSKLHQVLGLVPIVKNGGAGRTRTDA